MLERSKFSWRKRAMAFKYAWQGVVVLLKYEHNARIHAVCAVLAVVAGFAFDIEPWEWCAVAGCIGVVISAEAMNSAVEALADKITTRHDPLIGKAKDLGSAAVMLLAVMAMVVAAVIFLPKIMALFSKDIL